MMKREMLWNSIQAAVITGLLAVIGWLALAVINLQNQRAADDAENQLRQSITDAMNDVDKRLAVIEALISQRTVVAAPVATTSGGGSGSNDPGDDGNWLGGDDELDLLPPMVPMAPMGSGNIGPTGPEQSVPPRSDFDGPRYDLRKGKGE